MKSQKEKQTGNDMRARRYESEERSRRIRLGAEITEVVVGDRRDWSPLTLQQNGQLAGDANSAL